MGKQIRFINKKVRTQAKHGKAKLITKDKFIRRLQEQKRAKHGKAKLITKDKAISSLTRAKACEARENEASNHG